MQQSLLHQLSNRIFPQISLNSQNFSQGVQLSLLHQPSNRIFPRNSQISQNFLAAYILPRISQILTDF